VGLVALGIGVGLGIAFYRNMPAMTERAFGIVVLVYVVGAALAYFAGRHRIQQQWQFQIQQQEQAQQQDQTQQQAVVIQVLDRDQATRLAGGVPALAGDPASSPVTHSIQSSNREALQVGSKGSWEIERPFVAAKSEGAEGVGSEAQKG
jgi:hypothetical protein